MQTTVSATADQLTRFCLRRELTLICLLWMSTFERGRQTTWVQTQVFHKLAKWPLRLGFWLGISHVWLQHRFIMSIRGANVWRMPANHKARHKWKEYYISAGQVESFIRKHWTQPLIMLMAQGSHSRILNKEGLKQKNACEYSTKWLLPLHKSKRDRGT